MAPLPLNFPHEFISLPPFSEDEWNRFEETVDGRFSKESREKIALYAGIYASGLSFGATRPLKRDVAVRLRLIAKAAEELEALVASPEVKEIPVFKDAVRRLCFWLGQFDEPNALILSNLEGAKRIAMAATNAAKGEKGRPRDLASRHLVQLLFEECAANGIETTIPSNENKGEYGNKTRFFNLVKDMRSYISQIAQEAVFGAELTASEISTAKSAFIDWAAGKDGTLIEIMREVRQEMRVLPGRQNS